MYRKILPVVFFSFFLAIALSEDSHLKELQEIIQPLDHFNKDDARTFSIKYVTYDEDFKENGPIFLVPVCNVPRGTLDPYVYPIKDVVKTTKALLVFTELRFCESSLPDKYFDPDVFKYNTIEQSLQDVLHLIRKLKNNPRMSKSKVVAFGHTYDGIIVTWLRMKYPQEVYAAIAIDAPLNVKMETHDVFEDLSDEIRAKDQNCFDTINQGFKELMDVIRRKDSARLQQVFNFCEPQSLKPEDISTFLVNYCLTFRDNLGQDFKKCDNLPNMPGSPLDKIGALGKQRTANTKCTAPLSLHKYFASEFLKSGSVLTYMGIQAMFPGCSQYGNFLTSTNVDSLFADSIPLSYYTDHLCPALFGNDYSGDKIFSNIRETVEKYGGNNPNVTRMLFVYGGPLGGEGIRKGFSAEKSEVLLLDDARQTGNNKHPHELVNDGILRLLQ